MTQSQARALEISNVIIAFLPTLAVAKASNKRLYLLCLSHCSFVVPSDMAHEFQCRDVGENRYEGDAQFVIDAFDAALPHLASMGSGDQWGTQLFSKKTSFTSDIQDWIEKAGYATGSTKVFIAEVLVNEKPIAGGRSGPEQARGRVDAAGNEFIQAGAVVVHDRWIAPYVTSYYGESPLHPDLAASVENRDFMWMEILITDFRAGLYRKGAGAALISQVKEYARRIGRRYLWVHCWAGNDGKLAR